MLDTERFWAKVHKGDGCWEWIAGKFNGGYGAFQVGRKAMKAHRLAWEMENGPVPTGLCVCHKCDNPSCVRGDHLFVASNRENQLDKVAKRRHSHRGTHGRAKLTEKMVSDIRSRFDAGGVTKVQLSREYGVSDVQVGYIVRRMAWA